MIWNACLGGSGGKSRANGDRARQYRGAQRDPSKRDSFVKRLHKRSGLGGAVPEYDEKEAALGSYDELSGKKSIGPLAFGYPNPEDVGSVIVHEGVHESQADRITDYTRLKHNNAKNVLQFEAHSAELDPARNPFSTGISDSYRQHVESSRAGFYGAGNEANRAVMDSGQGCATSFCSE